MYTTSEWEDEETTVDYVTVAVFLPSGLDTEHIRSKVIEKGSLFEVTVLWIKPILDVNLLHKM